ncbi:HWE histidine kinase domain-containing protein [Yoonia sediminilitoris]|uniref:histidine kinase n=1 Tax=Yoonia sediminilitoris TaxID=1286148 RepID=A0A2T6KH39_9RHOB|nr:HWE histidine kinase domain-containing protein [Yoonia sediminilitoris]PUB14836.1 light-regulated signal transduction histidine kinase (bacteriophytochrome) [Yoonia sediminilitoris]RCW95553.1 light-regulated signal transduction histidine kinase (bacteriophytochrome) [Yoonia sediminilitoris]
MGHENKPTSADFAAALATCESEQVHLAGCIQPIGYLLAFDQNTGLIRYASENLSELLPHIKGGFFGKKLRDIFGPQVWHGVTNSLSMLGAQSKRDLVGVFDIAGTRYAFNALPSQTDVIVEIEREEGESGLSANFTSNLAVMMDHIQNAKSETALFQQAVELLRHMTQYDRVMAYKFDSDFNGEVLAEARRSRLEPFLGLRFPSWDIPKQVREIMKVAPIRFIADVDQEIVLIKAASDDLPPLDITYAQLRGVSPVHLEYLRNMGTQATMTLSIVIEDRLWGIISFHHYSPKIPDVDHRTILRTFQPIIATRTVTLLQEAQLAFGRELEQVKADLENAIDLGNSLDESLTRFAPHILTAFDADGTVLMSPDFTSSYGDVPNEVAQRHLLEIAYAARGKMRTYDNLGETFPALKADLNGLAGCLITPFLDDRAILVFRRPTTKQISWAGEPQKGIDLVGDKAILHPRNSFALYLQTVEDRSAPWTVRDMRIAEQLWGLLATADRHSLMNAMNRKQALMIDELNHRVRNILSLVRSVSRQARFHYGSLESYSSALEARIQALAAAHDIGSGAAVSAVPISRLLQVEAAPYLSDDFKNNVRITGADLEISAEAAPLFALVVHELLTNSAKYGALTFAKGVVEINLEPVDSGLDITWKESGGPPVQLPTNQGFGTTLIKQAVPYELGGESELDFRPEGVFARLFLPNRILKPLGTKLPSVSDPDPTRLPQAKLDRVTAPISQKQILIVEDNFMIAIDMKSVLRNLGFANIEIAADVKQAKSMMEWDTPDAVLLDIYLGPEVTSLPFAQELQESDIPFAFVTGYGDQVNLPASLAQREVFSKPVSTWELRRAVMGLLAPAED